MAEVDGDSIQPIPMKGPYPTINPDLPRKKPMKVLAFGLSRTGTMSLQTALGILGIRCYHGMESALNTPKNDHINLWNKAMDAKYHGIGTKWTGADLDLMLSHYDAVSDMPCIFFVDELLEAYPDAKVILTIRDVDSWKASILSTFYAVVDKPLWRLMARLDNQNLGPTDKLYTFALSQWTGGSWRDRHGLVKGYHRHNEHVIASVPADNLLQFNVKDGWGPLCKFLGYDVPDQPYPRINVGTEVRDLHTKFILRVSIVQWLLRTIMWAILAIAPVGLAYWLMI